MSNPYDPNSSDGGQRPPDAPPPGYGRPDYGGSIPGEPNYGAPSYGPGPGQGPQGYPPPHGSAYGYPAAGPTRPPVAGMGARLGARLLDGLILAIPSFLILGALLGDPAQLTVDPVTGEVSEAALAAYMSSLVTATLLYGVIALVYEVGLIATKGATLGKMALGIKVLDHQTGELLGWGRAFLRWLIPFLGSFICGIGQLVVYLSPFFDGSGQRRGWHDLVARDIVVKSR